MENTGAESRSHNIGAFTGTEGYALEFHDIVNDVKNKTRRSGADNYLRLIHGFSGKFHSGKLTAIMGPSGSCKTSFLDLLVGRAQPGSKTSGHVLFKGVPRNPSKWLLQIAYLEQDDFIIPSQTVYEFVHFAVTCRLPGRTGKEVNMLIMNAFEDLRIAQLADTVLGAVSGGERKRVMIAIEFIVGADILIFDEPTSGLDSHLALQLINMLKNYAHKENKIVLMTIHQLGSGLFQLIDNLLFVYKGLILYDNSIKNIDAWFAEHGLTLSNSLSKPEFLFELFTRRSIFPEVQAHDATIEKLITEKNTEASAMYSERNMYVGSDQTVDYGVSMHHIGKLIKRGLTLTLRGSGFLFLFLRFVLFAGLLWVFLYFTRMSILDQYTVCFENLDPPVKQHASFNGIATFLHDSVGLDRSMANIFFSHQTWPSLLLIMLLTAICSNASGFSSVAHVPLEIAKGTYSFGSYFLALLFTELLLDLVRCVIMAAILFGLQATFVLKTPFFALFLFSAIPLARVMTIPFNVVAESGIFNHMSTFLKSLFLLMPIFVGLLSPLKELPKTSPWQALNLLRLAFCVNGIGFTEAYCINAVFRKSVDFIESLWKSVSVKDLLDPDRALLTRASAEADLMKKLSNGMSVREFRTRESIFECIMKVCSFPRPDLMRKFIEDENLATDYFLVKYNRMLNIPLAMLAVVLCLVLSLIILRFRFTRNYRLKLS